MRTLVAVLLVLLVVACIIACFGAGEPPGQSPVENEIEAGRRLAANDPAVHRAVGVAASLHERASIGRSFCITVLGSDGEPVQGALCVLVAGQRRIPAADDVTELGSTGARGLCHYDAVDLGEMSEPSAIVVSKSGYRVATVPLNQDCTVNLRRALSLKVHCMSVGGGVVAGATIAASRRPLPIDFGVARHVGLTDDPVFSAVSDDEGTAVLSGLDRGTYFVGGFKAGWKCEWSGVVERISTDLAVERTVNFYPVFVAAVEFPVSGRLVTHNFRTHGVMGFGGRTELFPSLVALRKSRPGVRMGTVYGPGDIGQLTARFVGWHTRTGWVAREIPFTRMDAVDPVVVSASPGPEVNPGVVRVRFLCPEGEVQPVRIAYLTGGNSCGMPVPEAMLSRVPEGLRKDIVVRAPAIPEGRELPPGRYRLALADRTLERFVVEQPGLVEFGPSDEVTLTVKLSRKVAHLEPEIVASDNGERLAGNVAVMLDGEISQRQGVRPDRNFERSPGPIVPIGEPVELVVRAPGYREWRSFVTLSAEDPRVQCRLLKQ